MFSNLQGLSIRSLVVMFFVVGNCVLAIADKSYRPDFNQLSGMAITGYFAQMKPRS
jgi:hypothetical protein